MKPIEPPKPKLPEWMQDQIRLRQCSIRKEMQYLQWVKRFILFHDKRHPVDMGAAEVEAFLNMLANERRVSASTHNQALSAVLFLYREVLGIDLPWLNNIGRPQQTKRIPSVLTKDEVAGLLAQMDGVTALLARLLYGTASPLHALAAQV